MIITMLNLELLKWNANIFPYSIINNRRTQSIDFMLLLTYLIKSGAFTECLLKSSNFSFLFYGISWPRSRKAGRRYNILFTRSKKSKWFWTFFTQNAKLRKNTFCTLWQNCKIVHLGVLKLLSSYIDTLDHVALKLEAGSILNALTPPSYTAMVSPVNQMITNDWSFPIILFLFFHTTVNLYKNEENKVC